MRTAPATTTTAGRRARWLSPLFALAAVLAACGEDDARSAADSTVADDAETLDDTTETDATETETDTETETETQTEADTAADTDEDTEPEVIAEPVTFDLVHAVFVVKCVPCHAGPSAATSDGGHNMANPDVQVAYAASQLESSLPGRTKGALALQYVRQGIMPLGAGCTGRPADDADDPRCLSADEIDLLARWIDDGQLPPAE